MQGHCISTMQACAAYGVTLTAGALVAACSASSQPHVQARQGADDGAVRHSSNPKTIGQVQDNISSMHAPYRQDIISSMHALCRQAALGSEVPPSAHYRPALFILCSLNRLRDELVVLCSKSSSQHRARERKGYLTGALPVALQWTTWCCF